MNEQHTNPRTSQHFSIIRNLLIIVLFFLHLACASSAQNTMQVSGDNNLQIQQKSSLPPVFSNPHSQYSKARYLVSAGTGDSLDQAQQSALSGLAQQIEVQINSRFEASENYRLESGNQSAQLDTRIFDFSSSQSNEKLLGVEYGETFQDNLGRMYAIAFINRASVGTIYQDRIAGKYDEIQVELRSALESKEMKQYAHYLRAYNLSQDNEKLVKQLQVISPSHATNATVNNNDFRSAHIRELLAKSAGSMSFSIETEITGEKHRVNLEQLSTELRIAISELLSNLKFRIVNQGATHQSTATVVWDEDIQSAYPTIFWTLDFKIIKQNSDTTQVLISHNTSGRSKGIHIEAASRLAVGDITGRLSKSFATYITEQLAR